MFLHHLYTLREHRAAFHAAAGRSPRVALAIRTPWSARHLGWSPRSADHDEAPDLPDPAAVAAWERAELATDLGAAAAFTPLTPAERTEVVTGSTPCWPTPERRGGGGRRPRHRAATGQSSPVVPSVTTTRADARLGIRRNRVAVSPSRWAQTLAVTK